LFPVETVAADVEMAAVDGRLVELSGVGDVELVVDEDEDIVDGDALDDVAESGVLVELAAAEVDGVGPTHRPHVTRHRPLISSLLQSDVGIKLQNASSATVHCSQSVPETTGRCTCTALCQEFRRSGTQ
jgi:hypothetical protein